MAIVYISSTFTDLAEERKAVYVALRRTGHVSVGMEDYAASERRPLDRCLEDVRHSDVYVGIFGWRYGWVPPGQERSVTELELQEAERVGIPRLIFLLDDEAPWPRAHIDTDSRRIHELRAMLRWRYMTSSFESADQLAALVVAAIGTWSAKGSPQTIDRVDESRARTGADVFVSYAHEDLDIAESLAGRLEREGWLVFWDRHIPVGLTWDDIVEAALDAAGCVVVLWSVASTKSEWVRIEATEGAERGILAPALIQEAKVPLRFRRLQTANLIGWNANAPETSGLRDLVSAIHRCVGGKK